MPRPYARCREKFSLAVRALAIGEGDVRSRLQIAFKHLRRLSPAEVPQFAKDEWQSILDDLTRHRSEVGPDGEVYKTAIEHTMSRIQTVPDAR